MTVNQVFLTNLYSGGHIDLYYEGPQKFGGHNFFPNCQFADVLMKKYRLI